METFQFLFSRNPYPEELLKWNARLVLGEETSETIPYAICAAGVKKERKHEVRSFYLPQGLHCPEILKNHQKHNKENNNKWSSIQKYMWSVDFHPGPLVCNSDLFRELGFTFHMEID